MKGCAVLAQSAQPLTARGAIALAAEAAPFWFDHATSGDADSGGPVEWITRAHEGDLSSAVRARAARLRRIARQFSIDAEVRQIALEMAAEYEAVAKRIEADPSSGEDAAPTVPRI